MEKINCRLIIEGKNSACKNMAIDRAMLFSYEEVKIPTLRFYQWELPTLSFGFFQKVPEHLIKICKKNNIALVRRPTGGKAVLHDDEITYSIVAPYYLFSKERDILHVYNSIAQIFLHAFKSMNLNVELSECKTTDESSMFCFSEPSYYEITFNGKKLIGNAQRYNRDIFLQHGSLPISRNLDLINELFGEGHKNKWTSLEECLGYRPEIMLVQEKIINAFIDIFNFKFETTSYYQIEKDKAAEYEAGMNI
jgi:lipoate-protein ligase A